MLFPVSTFDLFSLLAFTIKKMPLTQPTYQKETSNQNIQSHHTFALHGDFNFK